jgi:hypothetical protein
MFSAKDGGDTRALGAAVSHLHRWVRQGVLAAGLAATATTNTSTSEIIHTAANHPWLTTDLGWVHAGDLRPGERVVTLPRSLASVATIAAVWVVPGAGEMDNLTVAQDHTYAVGATQAVVHNEGPCPDGLLYRNLRPDEDPAQGIFPKAPERTEITPAGHITNGSRPNFKGSPYISTTKSLQVATEWQGSSRMIAIDPAKVQGDILDFSTPELARAAGFGGRVYANAVSSHEVLIKGFSPPEAILWVREP